MVHGGELVAATDRPAESVIDQLEVWAHTDRAGVADAYEGMRVTAQVAAPGRATTVVASYSQGVFVIGEEGDRIASTPGFPCLGSQDELVGVKVVRSAEGTPIIAVAATQGGRLENSTTLELLSLGDTDQLNLLFVAEIAHHDEHGEHLGAVTLVPNGLVYRSPDNALSVWTLGDDKRHYARVMSLALPTSPRLRAVDTVD